MPRKRSSKKGPFPKQTQAQKTVIRPGTPVTSAVSGENRQLSAREKHSDVSQMWNQTLLRPNSTEHHIHKVVRSKNKLKARTLTYIIVLNSTAKNSHASNLKTNNFKHSCPLTAACTYHPLQCKHRHECVCMSVCVRKQQSPFTFPPPRRFSSPISGWYIG